MGPTQIALGGPPTLDYYPTGHNFGEKNRGEIDYAKLLIWSSGTCGDDMLFYTFTVESDWVTVTPTNGSCTCGEIDTIQIRIDTTDLSSGYHNTSIQITSNGGPGVYTVRVNVRNNPPIQPAMSGMRIGEAGTNFTYTCTSRDPEGDDLFYNFSWGDGTYSGWLGPYPSGEPAVYTHSWTKGTYAVQGKARDEKGAESNWSEPLIIVMPLRLPTLFRYFLRITNHQATSIPEIWRTLSLYRPELNISRVLARTNNL